MWQTGFNRPSAISMQFSRPIEESHDIIVQKEMPSDATNWLSGAEPWMVRGMTVPVVVDGRNAFDKDEARGTDLVCKGVENC